MKIDRMEPMEAALSAAGGFGGISWFGGFGRLEKELPASSDMGNGVGG